MFMMKWEAEREVEKERNQFKMMMVAARPEKAKEILEMFDNDDEDYTPPDPTIFEVPLSGDEIDFTLENLKKLGFSMEEIPD